MKKRPLILTIGISIIIFNACSTFFGERSEGFVTVNGTQFSLNGEPYYFAGTNFWYGCYLASSGETGDRERLSRELDFLKEHGITNLRVLAGSEESAIKKSLRPAITTKPGQFNEDILDGLDFLLNEIAKRNMRAVVFLNNYWEWSGGFGQYQNWFGGGEVVDPSVPESWPRFNDYVSGFYTNVEANNYFRTYIKQIITRWNQYSECYYYEDPAVMAWELANEPRPGNGESGERNIPNYLKWIKETAGYIKSLDPNHLVTTGNEGTIGSLKSEEYFLRAHQIKEIDYATFHMWATNWGWFNAKDKEGTFPRTKENAKNYIDLHLTLAEKLGKPLVLEEFGIDRDDKSYSRNSSVTVRDEYYKLVFDAVYDGAKAGTPIAGSNFWAWGGEGTAQHNDFMWRKGDSFTGDPPHEPQGWYSVFNSDASTIAIIKAHAERMEALSKTEMLTSISSRSD